MVKNLGQNPQTQDYSVIGRLLDESGNELFNVTKTFCCLNPGESTTLHFNDNYTIPSIGNYTFEIIKLGSSEFQGVDTLKRTITVFEAPTITSAAVQKISKTYVEISTGAIFSGDDQQRKISLPFNFIYNGFEYDKLQISTNGWVEFGTGTDGTERGLSTSSQIGNIGANENGRLASISRPNKALGPWWEDLNADGNGNVRYTSEGNSPNRVFIIQWQNLRAYWNSSTTTTRVNFQVRLYEGSNKIEFCYGHVVRGTFGGQDIGAMIGFKDYIGGDYHFYDIAAGGAIPAADVITDLSPLTDWPGEDSAYIIQTLITDVKDKIVSTPNNFKLFQNYPNPFNPSTTIKYRLKSASNVQLIVYDILGQQVATLVNQNQKAGYHTVQFDASNLASGTYIYKITAGEFDAVKKLLLIK